MVQFTSTSAFFVVALFASMNLSSVYAKPGLTLRDLVHLELAKRGLEYDSFHARDELEMLFGRHMDAEFPTLGSRGLEYEAMDLRKPSEHPNQQVIEHDPGKATSVTKSEHPKNFFQAIGDLVKRCAHGYWQHMIRKSQILVGKRPENTHELDFLPRSEAGLEELQVASRTWVGQVLRDFRDSSLGVEARNEPRDYSDDEGLMTWAREPLDQEDPHARDWDWIIDDLD